jgi:excinuclease UvrABC nuclease subunit
MALKFEKKFGPDFLKSVPTCPGVYFFRNQLGELIYIGKAKNLRRRLGQYKNAKRRKKHAKMRSIITEAASLEFQTLATDLDACLEETRLIQEHRPKWNVAGAFYFLYPMLGIHHYAGITRICYTTKPELFPEFRFFGSYRSRYRVKEAFFGLAELLQYIGHKVKKPARQTGDAKNSYVVSFRQIPENWIEDWCLFFKGESQRAAETLVLSLVENAGARNSPEEIQESLNSLKRFWRHEARKLYRILERTRFPVYPLPQKERDLLILKYKESFKTAPKTAAASQEVSI